MALDFYLGTHKPAWLWKLPIAGPFFVSRTTLETVTNWYPAKTRWAMDSGGFTEVTQYGGWRTGPTEYVALTQRVLSEIGSLDFAAPQDWMCEDLALKATGLTVVEHQIRTTDNFIALRSSSIGETFIPVIQGRTCRDYVSHVIQYMQRGVDLSQERVVGIGSVCRRQATDEFVEISDVLGTFPVRFHGFGVKQTGLLAAPDFLRSSDSLAWSFHARHRPARAGCVHRNCANCPFYADDWRNGLRTALDKSERRN